MRVSFDFDGVLSREGWRVIAAYHVHEGDIVYILTARCPEQGDRVRSLAQELGIEPDNVIFTCNRDKWEQIDPLGINLHYDNDEGQVEMINQDTAGLALDVSDLDPARYLLEGIDQEVEDANPET